MRSGCTGSAIWCPTISSMMCGSIDAKQSWKECSYLERFHRICRNRVQVVVIGNIMHRDTFRIFTMRSRTITNTADHGRELRAYDVQSSARELYSRIRVIIARMRTSEQYFICPGWNTEYHVSFRFVDRCCSVRSITLRRANSNASCRFSCA